MVATIGEGNGEAGRVNWVKGVKHMVTEGNYTFDGKHTAEYIDIRL